MEFSGTAQTGTLRPNVMLGMRMLAVVLNSRIAPQLDQ